MLVPEKPKDPWLDDFLARHDPQRSSNQQTPGLFVWTKDNVVKRLRDVAILAEELKRFSAKNTEVSFFKKNKNKTKMVCSLMGFDIIIITHIYMCGGCAEYS